MRALETLEKTVRIRTDILYASYRSASTTFTLPEINGIRDDCNEDRTASVVNFIDLFYDIRWSGAIKLLIRRALLFHRNKEKQLFQSILQQSKNWF